MLRTLGQKGRWVRLLMVLVFMLMSANLITAAPASEAKSYPTPTAELDVFVVADNGGVDNGIANAVVVISNDTGMPVAKEMTNETGHCLVSLTAGTYIVDAIADGYYNKKELVEVNAGGPTRVLEMVLQPQPAPVPTYRTLAVFVAEGQFWGKGVAGAQVTVYTPAHIWAQGLTDEMGYFKPSLLPGAYMLTVSAEGYIEARVPVEVGTGPATDFTVVLHPQPLQLLTVFAVGATGDLGIPGASVGIFNNGALVTKGLTNDRGYYTPMLLPGLYKLIVSAPKYETATTVVEVTDTRENNAVVVLQPTIYRTLQVLVKRGDQNMVITKASVTVLDAGQIIQAQGLTDRGGYYRPNLPIGSYTVIVNALGYDQTKLQVEVTQAPMTKLMVWLYPSTH